jgi:hypothetical protein
MDEAVFDRWTRILSQRWQRRRLREIVPAAGLVAALGLAGNADHGDARKKRKRKKKNRSNVNPSPPPSPPACALTCEPGFTCGVTGHVNCDSGQETVCCGVAGTSCAGGADDFNCTCCDPLKCSERLGFTCRSCGLRPGFPCVTIDDCCEFELACGPTAASGDQTVCCSQQGGDCHPTLSNYCCPGLHCDGDSGNCVPDE